MTEQVITFEAMEQAANLFGSFDENIKLLEREYGVTITCRGADLKVVGGRRECGRRCPGAERTADPN